MRLFTSYSNLIISRLVEEESPDSHVTDNTVLFGRVLHTTRPITDYKVLYIGDEGSTLTNFMLTLKENEVY